MKLVYVFAATFYLRGPTVCLPAEESKSACGSGDFIAALAWTRVIAALRLRPITRRDRGHRNVAWNVAADGDDCGWIWKVGMPLCSDTNLGASLDFQRPSVPLTLRG